MSCFNSILDKVKLILGLNLRNNTCFECALRIGVMNIDAICLKRGLVNYKFAYKCLLFKKRKIA